MSELKIAILGCSGSGKSTLSRRLGNLLDLPVIELDSLYHQPNWVEADPDDFRESVAKGLATHSSGWIVDGNYNSALGDLVLAQATHVYWFDLPRNTVMKRVIWRSIRRVVTRQELWNGNRERFTNLFSWDPHKSIIRWSWTRHAQYRERLFDASENKPVQQTWIRLTSQSHVEQALIKIRSEIDAK